MTKQIKKHRSVSPQRLEEFRRAALIASAGASVRLSGSKVTDKEVEQILSAISKPSVRK